MLQGGGIDERLEARSRLALGLDGAVELAAIEVEAAGQGLDRAVVRIERDQGTFDGRNLHQTPAIFLELHAYHVATLENVVSGFELGATAIFIDIGPRPLDALPGDLHLAKNLGVNGDRLVFDLDDDGRQQSRGGGNIG